MIACTGARPFLLSSVLQFRLILLVSRSGNDSDSLPLPFSTRAGLLPAKCSDLLLQRDNPLHLSLHLHLHLPHPLQDGSVERLLIGLTLLQDTYVIFAMIDLLNDPLEVVLDIPHILRIVLKVNVQARLRTIGPLFITKDLVQ